MNATTKDQFPKITFFDETVVDCHGHVWRATSLQQYEYKLLMTKIRARNQARLHILAKTGKLS